MKLTKTQLRQIIEEEINALAEEEEGEGYMAVSQLEYMKEIIPKIQQYVNDASDLEEWVESKITLAHEYIETVYGHFEGTDKPKVRGTRSLDSMLYPDGRELDEEKLTKAMKKEKEKVVKGMKKNKKDFKKRYGDDAESVMYATATKIAKEKK